MNGDGYGDGEEEEEEEEDEDENAAFQMMLPLATVAAASSAAGDKENAGDGGNYARGAGARGRGIVTAGGRRHSTGSAGSGNGNGNGNGAGRANKAAARRSMPAALPSLVGGGGGGLDAGSEFSSGPPVPASGKKRVDWSKGEPAARMRAAIAECREITQHGSSAAGSKSWRGVARKYGISWAVLYPRLSGKISVDACLGGGKTGPPGDQGGDGDDAGAPGAAGAALPRDAEVKLFNACCSAARRGRVRKDLWT
jgi:hypothetical protein